MINTIVDAVKIAPDSTIVNIGAKYRENRVLPLDDHVWMPEFLRPMYRRRPAIPTVVKTLTVTTSAHAKMYIAENSGRCPSPVEMTVSARASPRCVNSSRN